MQLNDAMQKCGLIAILRGVTPNEVIEVVDQLYETGIRIVEVPLNSPDPFSSIGKLADHFKDKMVVGAGTVLSLDDVQRLRKTGGTISVSPDCNTEVIASALQSGLDPLPGVFTPTEAFAAIRAGAQHLKLFPADVVGPAAVRAWKAVLPQHLQIHAVGGITPHNISEWLACGVSGFGIGTSLYHQGKSLLDIRTSAEELVSAWRNATSLS